METEAVRRRMNMIAAHFAPSEDMSPTHLLPMNCSSSLNFVMPRYDNRMYFARQGSASQAFFMRQVSTEQGSPEKPGIPFNCSASEAPFYSRPTKMGQNLSNAEPIQSPAKACKSFVSSDLPNFARPSTCIGRKKQSDSKKKICSPSQTNGIEWSPRMDVAESGRSYVVTVELPGVNVNDIRVEVNDQNLTIMGKRSTQSWSNDSISAYHKREILQGPYQVVWPLPSNINKDRISAEFLDGILEIIIPKV
ncbi:small heat-shock protein, putative [Ricinus communis]|uniref:Small heat-shock protein, putative n=1 Tax=Ricinus communis TaxID=3988 RepID=B9SIR7_RICCO|nr:small heat-shock protein, putative [Ricinus communis]